MVVTDVDGTTLAIIMKHKQTNTGDIEFVSHDNDSLQLAVMHRQAGEKIAKHYHNPVKRELIGTAEVLLIKSGIIHVEIYSKAQRKIQTVTLTDGDAIVLLAGGHSIHIVKETVMHEIKQGPYAGQNDKTYF